MRVERISEFLNLPKFFVASKQILPMLVVLTSFVIPAISDAQNLLNFPQKIVIDAERDRLIVSNFGGPGALVQIDSEGNQEYFVSEAGCVDGMDIVGEVVYGVGRGRKLYGYDLATGQQVLDFAFPPSPGAYLSSVASDEEGHLFISCPALHTIYKYRISDETFTVFAQDNGLRRPNGICLEREKDRIVVIDDSSGTSIIHAISLSDGTVSDLLTTDLRNPDGIVRDVNGTYYIGGYYLPGLYRVDSEFSQQPEMFFEGSHMVYPTYDARDHSLLITYYGAHSWDRVMLPAGTLTGTVSFSLLQNAILEDVGITVGAMILHPDDTGVFSKNVPIGTFDVTASLEGYGTVIIEDVEFFEDQVTSLTFELRRLSLTPDSVFQD